MSHIKVMQIKAKLLSLFEAHLDVRDISTKDKERETKILSRCLAAAAIRLKTGCTEKDAATAVWDGADDNGIDAAYFDPSESRVIFVQSKLIQKGSGEPEAKDIGAFIKGVRDAIESDNDNFHQRLQGKLNDICQKLLTPGTSILIVIATTGTNNLAKHSSSIIDGFLDDLNENDPDGIVSSEVLGLHDIYAALANDSAAGAPTIEANITDWSYVSSPYPARRCDSWVRTRVEVAACP